MVDDQDFHTLLSRISDALPERESRLTVGGATALSLFAAVIAFLCLGYFTNAGDIKSLKLQDEHMTRTIVEMKDSFKKTEGLIYEIRMDQIRREKMEK